MQNNNLKEIQMDFCDLFNFTIKNYTKLSLFYIYL